MPATETIAVYEADEGILRLEGKLDLPDLERVRIVVEPMLQGMSLARRLGGDITADEETARQIIESEDLPGCD